MALIKHGRGKVLAAQTQAPDREDEDKTDEDWTEDDQFVLDQENAEADEETR